MDWARAIEINTAALSRIVAALVALLEAQGDAVRLPLSVYQMIARILHPAESAVRRLIVIAARGVDVPLAPVRAMPQGLVITGKGAGRRSFQLFDTRKSFSFDDACDEQASGPRIRSVGPAAPRAVFLAKFAAHDVRDEATSAKLVRRLTVLKQALDTLPRQAKRMARWLKRRAAMVRPKFTSPLRPGAPPGQRKRSRDEIDLVLRECHALALDALRRDSS